MTDEAIIQLWHQGTGCCGCFSLYNGPWRHGGRRRIAASGGHGRAAVRRTGRIRPGRSGRAAAHAGRAECSDRRQFLEVRRLARASLLARAVPFARPVLDEAVSKRVSARIRRDLPHGLRRFRVLPVPQRGILAETVRPDAPSFSVRLQSAGTNHLQSVSGASALWLAGWQGEPGVPRCAARSRRCFCARCCRTAGRRRC